MRRALLCILLAGCPQPSEVDSGTDAGHDVDAGHDAGEDGGQHSEDAGQTGEDAGASDAGTTSGHGLPVVHLADAGAAERGSAMFTGKKIGGKLIPRQALRQLWLVWAGAPPANDDAYWALFRERYGLSPAPFENDGYPAGLHAVDATYATLDCLACHAGTVNGQTVIGLPNSQFDLQGLFDDLYALAAIAQMYGITVPPFPFTMTGRTQASGANDAMGLGFDMAQRFVPAAGVHTRMGFQRPPAWWSIKHKQALYVGGEGEVGSSRLMMATLLATQSLTELQTQDDDFEDLAQYLLTLEPPPFPGTLDAELLEQGQTLFAAHCSSCHGTYDGEARVFPNVVVEAGVIGTDALRASRMGEPEVAYVNASWFGEKHPLQVTGGYLAPVLTGVWATAPYFHNASVPSLEGVLDSTQRPARWRSTASGYESVSVAQGQASIAARRVHDNEAEGLANGGHTYGDALSASERAAVIEYLKSL